MPHNVEAEASLLGAILIDADALVKIADIVGVNDFYDDRHKHIYEAVIALYERRSPIDVRVSVRACLPPARERPGHERKESQIAIEVGATIQATVARIENYGAFLQLEDGRMGLVHISEIDRNYVKDVREHLREGDSVEVKVTSIKDDGKIDLSIKALQDPAPRQSRRGTDQEFEQKLKKFMRQSEERQVDFRRATEHKRK